MTSHYSPKTQIKGLAVFILFMLVFVLFVELYQQDDIEDVVASEKDVVDAEMRKSIDNIYPYEYWIQNKKDVYYTEMVEDLKKAKKIKRVLRGELAGKEEIFLKSFSSPEIGKYVMSAIVAESGGGQKPCGKFNYSGIMKNGKCENFDSLEDYINSGVKAKTGKYFNELYKSGVSAESLQNIFIGSYCQSGCEHWVGNFLSTYEKL